jgi:hypothetical protein
MHECIPNAGPILKGDKFSLNIQLLKNALEKKKNGKYIYISISLSLSLSLSLYIYIYILFMHLLLVV